MKLALFLFLILFSFNLFSKNILLHIEGDLNKDIIRGINISLKKNNIYPLSEKLSKEIFKLKVKNTENYSYECLRDIYTITRVNTIIIIKIIDKKSYYVLKSTISFKNNKIRKTLTYYNKTDNDFVSFGKESINYLLKLPYEEVFYFSKEAMNPNKITKNSNKLKSKIITIEQPDETAITKDIENIIKIRIKTQLLQKKR